MDEILNLAIVPVLLTQFVLTVALSFIIGLELHSYRRANGQDLGFGTTRTFTLIGILGFLLFMIDDQLWAWLFGLMGLFVLLAVYYYRRSGEGIYSLLSPVLGLLTYMIAPVLVRFPDWFTILFVVTVLLMLSAKPGIRRFSDAFREAEMFTFTKFLIMAGVVLPLLPDRQISSIVTVTYYQVWVALLVVSGLSYISYLVQTYVFKEKGLLLTGVLGGLYSSTATTIVLGRRAREMAPTPQVTQAIILATAMMYLRLLLLLLFIGHLNAVLQLMGPFLAFLAASLAATWLAGRIPVTSSVKLENLPLSHPLEFKTALIFSVLFVVFAAISTVVIGRYGNEGLQVLSFVVGLTDIDPFILSLLGGKFQISEAQIITAIVTATGSNNLVKAVYALVLGRDRFSLAAAVWLMILFAASMIYVFW
ncbi:MAG: DUF4010 domain-containing protein [Lysobacterales bacterium]